MIPLLLAAQLLQSGFYERGMDAAQSGQWDRARREFLAGQSQFPADKRFSIELAGVEYRTGRTAAAREYLRAALDIDPRDAYANDFLGTLYFLGGNYEAALRYWNRIGKPRVGPLQVVPGAPVSPVLLDRAVAFAPGEVLLRDEFEDTQQWLRGLGVFGNFKTELAAREDAGFDPVLRWSRASPWTKAVVVLGGAAAQTYRYSWENVGRRAITATGAIRWDAQKRRLFASVAGPLGGDPRRLFTVFGDLRSETWNIGEPEDFRLRKAEAGARLRFQPNARFYGETGATLASRSYVGNHSFESGFTAVSATKAGYRIVNLPEHGFAVESSASWHLGRFFASGGGVYSKAQAEVLARWRPQPSAPRHEATVRAGFGRIFGAAPFDERFILGRQRDDGLPVRGLLATRNGKKGRAPVGNQYALMNLDFFKQVWNPLLVAIDAGALVDVGVVSHTLPGAATGRLAITPGLQTRLRLPNGLALVVSYARDLRGGGSFDIGFR